MKEHGWYVLQPEFRPCIFLFSYPIQSTNTFCVQLNDDFLCPDNPPLFVRGKFKLLSGFAPYSVGDVKMKPKWSDEFQFPGDAKTVVFGPNYCFFTKETDRVRCKLVESYKV